MLVNEAVASHQCFQCCYRYSSPFTFTFDKLLQPHSYFLPIAWYPPMTTSCLITQLIRVSSSSEREVDSLAVHPLIVEGQLNLFSYAYILADWRSTFSIQGLGGASAFVWPPLSLNLQVLERSVWGGGHVMRLVVALAPFFLPYIHVSGTSSTIIHAFNSRIFFASFGGNVCKNEMQ